MELTSSHKYIKNTPTCGTILTEHLLNTGRRPQTSKRARKSLRNRVGQKKKKKERNRDGTCAPGKELQKRKGLHTLVSPLTGGEIKPGQMVSFGASEESETTGLWRAKWRKTCTEGQCRHLALPSLRRSAAGAGGGWVLSLGLQRSYPGRGLGLATWRQPEGAKVWCTTIKGIQE